MNAIIGTLAASHTRHQSQTNPPVPLRTAAWLSRLNCASYLPLPGDLRPEFMLDCHCPAKTNSLQHLLANSRPILEKPLARTLLPIEHKEIAQILQFRINGCRTQDPRPLSPPAQHWCLQRAEDSFSS